jgi:hypothetical protein
MTSNAQGVEMAYRDSLFQHIFASGDKTVCNQTSLFVPNLGAWERKLGNVLGNRSN